MSQKGLILLSATAASPALFPTLFGEIDTLVFSLVGWLIVIMLAIWEFLTSVTEGKTPKETVKNKKAQRSELYSKVITYSLMFIALIFLHNWISHSYSIYFSSITGFLVVALYIISALGEIYFIGSNLEQRYGVKPSIFKFLDSVNERFQKIIINRIEKNVCKTDEEKK